MPLATCKQNLYIANLDKHYLYLLTGLIVLIYFKVFNYMMCILKTEEG
jgi:hypothetical protein